jgi:hypothetical protein
VSSTEIDAIVKFSGGRDSSLAAALLCLEGHQVQLLRYTTGFGIPSDLPLQRIAELRRAFPTAIYPVVPVLPVYGLVRRIAVATIEEDFRRYGGYNLVLLGEALALHAAGLVHCLSNGVPALADGSSGYQTDMPEQRAVALEQFRLLTESYGISYLTPVIGYPSADEVKYQLLDLGISTKSLEGISMFSDSFSYADDDKISAYLVDKVPIARSFIAKMSVTRTTGA